MTTTRFVIMVDIDSITAREAYQKLWQSFRLACNGSQPMSGMDLMGSLWTGKSLIASQRGDPSEGE